MSRLPSDRRRAQRTTRGVAVAACWLGLAACSDPVTNVPTTSEPTPPVETQPEGNALTCGDQRTTPAAANLLTRQQYDNVVRDLLGDETNPSRAFPPEARAGRFIDTASHQINTLLADQHALVASDVATRAVSERLEQVAPCASGVEQTCGHTFVDTFGRRAFRRPLSEPERVIFAELFDEVLATQGYATAVRAVLTAFLQSPQFLYRVDSHVGLVNDDGAVRLNPYETASRLSFFLYNSMPDEELLVAAETAQLGTLEQVETQARRMLRDPKAREAVRNFFSMWLGLSDLDVAARVVTTGEADPSGADPTAFNAAWRESVLSFVDYVYWEKDGSIDELLTSDVVFLNAELGALYGVTVEGDGFLAVNDPERYGLFTQPGLMALLAHPEQSSPILRGVFVRSHVLCQPPPAPPPNVDATPPAPDPALDATTRERFLEHTQNPECASCHALIDPLGFIFEGFDHVGRYRATDDGLDVDTSGSIVGLTDQTLNGDYTGPRDLADRMLASEQLRTCIARQWFRHALVRPDTSEDVCSVYSLSFELAETRNLTELLVAITLTDAFRFRSAGEQDH